jgi:hypothetical protein
MEQSSAIATAEEKKEPVADNASSHLRNALQVVMNVRALGGTGDGYIVTAGELTSIEDRINSALRDIERDAIERRGILAMMEDRS